MKTIEKIFFLLFPLALLKGTQWEAIWHEREKREFLTIVRVFFSITLIGYILHYYTVDRAEGLAPSTLWFNYRYGMAAVSAFCLAIYSIPTIYGALKYYRLPAILAGACFCYFQARTVIWYPKVPYLYAFAFVLACTIILRTSILKSVVASLIDLAMVSPTLVEANVSPAMTFSAGFFTMAVIVFARTKYTADLKYFIATQKNIQNQKRIIEINMEFTNQIKAFLPAEISRRLNAFIQDQRMSVIQSIDEVLRPKKQFVACIFSDIRGFTQGSKDLTGFVSESMLPNVKGLTQIVEKYQGIPRKIGDLIFAYYDFSSPNKCIEMAMRCAIEMARLNQEHNEALNKSIHIKRYILLSFGDAIVGNLSGYESSIEITAIGAPVNFLSRLDEITKTEALGRDLASGDIIFSNDALPFLKKNFPTLPVTEIDLAQRNLTVRDFESITKIYILRINEIISHYPPKDQEVA